MVGPSMVPLKTRRARLGGSGNISSTATVSRFCEVPEPSGDGLGARCFTARLLGAGGVPCWPAGALAAIVLPLAVVAGVLALRSRLGAFAGALLAGLSATTDLMSSALTLGDAFLRAMLRSLVGCVTGSDSGPSGYTRATYALAVSCVPSLLMTVPSKQVSGVPAVYVAMHDEHAPAVLTSPCLQYRHGVLGVWLFTFCAPNCGQSAD